MSQNNDSNRCTNEQQIISAMSQCCETYDNIFFHKLFSDFDTEIQKLRDSIKGINHMIWLHRMFSDLCGSNNQKFNNFMDVRIKSCELLKQLIIESKY